MNLGRSVGGCSSGPRKGGCVAFVLQKEAFLADVLNVPYPENSRLKILAYQINRKMTSAISDEPGTWLCNSTKRAIRFRLWNCKFPLSNSNSPPRCQMKMHRGGLNESSIPHHHGLVPWADQTGTTMQVSKGYFGDTLAWCTSWSIWVLTCPLKLTWDITLSPI